jgi:hypothetical protein
LLTHPSSGTIAATICAACLEDIRKLQVAAEHKTRRGHVIDRFDPTELSENVRTRFYIGGQWRRPRSAERLEIISPLTEKTQLSVPGGTAEDMDDAVAAAAEAFDRGPWPRMTPLERAAVLRRLGEEVEKRLPLFQRVWTAQVGVVQGFAGMISRADDLRRGLS